MQGKNCGLCGLSWILVVIGGLNWGLVGLFQWNLVHALFGGWMWLENLIYILVGIGALVLLAKHMGWCKKCCGGACKN